MEKHWWLQFLSCKGNNSVDRNKSQHSSAKWSHSETNTEVHFMPYLSWCTHVLDKSDCLLAGESVTEERNKTRLQHNHRLWLTTFSFSALLQTTNKIFLSKMKYLGLPKVRAQKGQTDTETDRRHRMHYQAAFVSGKNLL